MKTPVALILAVPALSPAAPLSEMSDAEVTSLARAVTGPTLARAIEVRYTTCPADVDLDAQVTVAYPIEFRYRLDLSDADATVDTDVIRLALRPPEPLDPALTEVFSDDADNAATLNAALMRHVIDGVYEDMPAIAAHFGVANNDAAIRDGLRTELQSTAAIELSSSIDAPFSVIVEVAEPSGEPPPLPRLELCPDTELRAAVVTESIYAPKELGRGAFPVQGSAVARKVFEYLRTDAGDVVAFRVRGEKVEVPLGRVSVSSMVDDVPLTDGREGYKIVGGTEVPDGEMPWAVAFARRNAVTGKLGNYCGGTVIEPGWVVTAAHCMVDDASVAIIGRHSISGDGGEEKGVETAWRHVAFDKSTGPMYDNDIALVKLKDVTSFTEAPFVEDAVSDAESVKAIGWGATEFGGGAIDKLHWVTLRIVPHGTCVFNYLNQVTKVTDNMICASDIDKDACQGDSGGGLFYEEEAGEYRLAGIVSFGKGCAQPSFPGVYTDISDYEEWVLDVMSSTDIVSDE